MTKENKKAMEENSDISMIQEETTESSVTSSESINDKFMELEEKEAELQERERLLDNRERLLEEQDQHLRKREQALAVGTKEEPATAPKGLEFVFRDKHYKFQDDAPKSILFSGEVLTQEEITKDEEILVQLIGGKSPLIVEMFN